MTSLKRPTFTVTEAAVDELASPCAALHGRLVALYRITSRLISPRSGRYTYFPTFWGKVDGLMCVGVRSWTCACARARCIGLPLSVSTALFVCATAVLHPLSRLRLYWDAVLAALATWSLIETPLRLAFSWGYPHEQISGATVFNTLSVISVVRSTITHAAEHEPINQICPPRSSTTGAASADRDAHSRLRPRYT